jgi:hypothetical protein
MRPTVEDILAMPSIASKIDKVEKIRKRAIKVLS